LAKLSSGYLERGYNLAIYSIYVLSPGEIWGFFI